MKGHSAGPLRVFRLDACIVCGAYVFLNKQTKTNGTFQTSSVRGIGLARNLSGNKLFFLNTTTHRTQNEIDRKDHRCTSTPYI